MIHEILQPRETVSGVIGIVFRSGNYPRRVECIAARFLKLEVPRGRETYLSEQGTEEFTAADDAASKFEGVGKKAKRIDGVILNFLLLFIGMFLEGGAAIIILAPTLLNVATSVGIEPLHFGMIMVLNMAVGLLTPPLGVCLFVVCGVTKLDLGYVIKAVMPFVWVEIGVVLLITYVPDFCLTLPRLLGYI